MDIDACKKLAEEIKARGKRARAKRGPDPFMEGFAIALADLVRLHDQPAMAADVIAGHGFTLDDFAGCESYDLSVIRKLFRTETALRR